MELRISEKHNTALHRDALSALARPESARELNVSRI